MKKLLSVVFVGLMLLMCAACGEPKKETAVCTLVPADVVGVTIEITLEAEKDIIHTMTQFTTIELSNFPEEEVELLEESLDDLKEVYKNYSGAQFSGEIKDGMYYQTIVVDMTNANTLKSMQENSLLPFEAEANKTSLDKTVERLESLDWKVEMK